MAEEEDGSGSGRSDKAAEQGLDPEMGPSRAPKKALRNGTALLLEMADEAVVEQLQEIVDCVVVNIKAGHLPSAKLLLELVARLKLEEDIPEEDYRSLAEVLWKDLEARTVPGKFEVVATDATPVRVEQGPEGDEQ